MIQVVSLLFYDDGLALNNPQKLICHLKKETKTRKYKIYFLAVPVFSCVCLNSLKMLIHKISTLGFFFFAILHCKNVNSLI